VKILFVTVVPVKQGPTGPTSDLASARYRAIIPAAELVSLGHKVHLHSAREWTKEILDFDCDVMVVSKSLDRANEALAAEVKARGVKLVVDMCDNIFDDWKYGEHFRAMVELADVVTCSTEAMAEAIKVRMGRESFVINEPVEGPRGAPRFAPRLPGIKMLWFGNLRSLDCVRERIDQLAEACEVHPLELVLCTLSVPEVKQLVAELASLNPSRLTTRLVRWSPEATWSALDECDLVWIPSAAGDFHRTKSPNRLVETLWAGRVALVDPIPSHAPFEAFVPMGKRLLEAIAESLEAGPAVEGRIAEAQRLIATLHSPRACALQWVNALSRNGRSA